MRLLPWLLLPILSLFRLEIFHIFANLSFAQCTLLAGITILCLIAFRKKLGDSIISFVQNIKNFNFRRYRRKLLEWAKENNSGVMGKSFVSRLERSMFIKLGCIMLAAIFGCYPMLLTNPKPAAIFLLTLTIYALMSLAFRREILIVTIGMYIFMAVTPYVMVFLNRYSSMNVFETLPPDLVYLLNMDVLNTTQTANKLFLLITPLFGVAILFFVLSACTIRGFANLIHIALIKFLQQRRLWASLEKVRVFISDTFSQS
ncbi:MAG: hypothetical protein JOZ78_09820 [Chroococcidiopsidaceae cyanobacterium CP_BM_ER_R8_30]|nr:hypothetical protein [Chroococcidiopsidaceae cyanobacterium CP_BM_ER_R8_30]